MFEFAYKEIVEESPQSMRAQEARAMDQVIDLLRRADDAGPGTRETILALYQLRSLWAVFLEDLSGPENALSPTLRAGLISIGIWVNKEIDRVRTGTTKDLNSLIEINQIVRNGLN